MQSDNRPGAEQRNYGPRPPPDDYHQNYGFLVSTSSDDGFFLLVGKINNSVVVSAMR